jgi:hypothetical protein
MKARSLSRVEKLNSIALLMMMMMMVFIRTMMTLLIIMMMFSGAINLFVQSIACYACCRQQRTQCAD